MSLVLAIGLTWMAWVATDTLGLPNLQHWMFTVLIAGACSSLSEIAGDLRKIASTRK